MTTSCGRRTSDLDHLIAFAYKWSSQQIGVKIAVGREEANNHLEPEHVPLHREEGRERL